MMQIKRWLSNSRKVATAARAQAGIQEMCEDQLCGMCQHTQNPNACKQQCITDNIKEITSCCTSQCAALPGIAKDGCISSCVSMNITPPDMSVENYTRSRCGCGGDCCDNSFDKTLIIILLIGILIAMIIMLYKLGM
jgi:hypothetical protein